DVRRAVSARPDEPGRPGFEKDLATRGKRRLRGAQGRLAHACSRYFVLNGNSCARRSAMNAMTSKVAIKTITKQYIDGAFVESHGRELMDIINPTNGEVIAHVTLADEEDARRAIAAAKQVFPSFRRTTKEERSEILRNLHSAVSARIGDLTDVMVEEYGGIRQFAGLIVQSGADVFLAAEKALHELPLTWSWGKTTVTLEPVGVAGLISPWNANAFFLCVKLASAVAAGCTVVMKPSELSSLQTQVWLECVHAANLPKGLCNVVLGRGDVVGAELVRNPDVAKISFTGSAAVGRSIMRDCAATMKRVTLELGGKSPNILLDDADLKKAIPNAFIIGFLNNGQVLRRRNQASCTEESLRRSQTGNRRHHTRLSCRRSNRSKNSRRTYGEPETIRARAIIHSQ